jgi:hypothetical protein
MHNRNIMITAAGFSCQSKFTGQLGVQELETGVRVQAYFAARTPIKKTPSFYSANRTPSLQFFFFRVGGIFPVKYLPKRQSGGWTTDCL